MAEQLTHLEFHINLLKASFNRLLKQPPFNGKTIAEDDQDFLQQLVNLVKALESHDSDALFLGQELIGRLIRGYPHLVPLIDRDLFWFFGGDCLHYMPDAETALFQQLDELRFEAEAKGEPFNLEDARARLFKLH